MEISAFIAFLALRVIAIQHGWLTVDDSNTGFSNALAAVLVKMIPSAGLKELKKETSRGESPKKKPKNSKNPQKRLKKPKNFKDWWDSDYYKNKPARSARRVVDNTGITERTYQGHRLLPPDLGGSL